MIKINLLPKEARKRVGLGQQIFTMIFVLVAAFVAIGFYWSYLNGVIEQKTQEIAKTQQRLQELQKIIAKINQFEKDRQALEDKLKVIATLEKEQQLPVHMLDELYRTLKEDMWLNSFEQNNMAINVTGTALSNPVVSDYLRNLEVSKYFGNIELLVSQRRIIGSQTVRDFQINMTLTPPKAEQGEEVSE